jgi:hypothetical protein
VIHEFLQYLLVDLQDFYERHILIMSLNPQLRIEHALLFLTVIRVHVGVVRIPRCVDITPTIIHSTGVIKRGANRWLFPTGLLYRS